MSELSLDAISPGINVITGPDAPGRELLRVVEGTPHGTLSTGEVLLADNIRAMARQIAGNTTMGEGFGESGLSDVVLESTNQQRRYVLTWDVRIIQVGNKEDD